MGVLIGPRFSGMLSITAIAPGEVGVRELMLGIVVVGVVLGIMVGRVTERARRNFKDYGVAKSAVPKGRSLAFAEVRRAAFTILVVGGVMTAIFIGVINMPR